MSHAAYAACHTCVIMRRLSFESEAEQDEFKGWVSKDKGSGGHA